MVTIEQLSFAYSGLGDDILRDINLTISNGEYLSIIGENGSGKTTFMRLLLGLLKPTKGIIQINAKAIGYVPQKNDNVNTAFPITVFEALNSYRHLLKIKDKEIVMRALETVGMEKQYNHLMGNLSGGQTQKILLARAIMGNPELLILDEPSTGIDLDSQRDIYKLLKKLNTEKNMTIIAVEHNLEAVYANSTNIFHLQNGCGHLCNPDKYAKEYLRLEGGSDASV